MTVRSCGRACSASAGGVLWQCSAARALNARRVRGSACCCGICFPGPSVHLLGRCMEVVCHSRLAVRSHRQQHIQHGEHSSWCRRVLHLRSQPCLQRLSWLSRVPPFLRALPTSFPQAGCTAGTTHWVPPTARCWSSAPAPAAPGGPWRCTPRAASSTAPGLSGMQASPASAAKTACLASSVRQLAWRGLQGSLGPGQ